METTEIRRDPTATEDLREAWLLVDAGERYEEFARLPRADADDLILELSSRDQSELLSARPVADRRSWVRLLPPDDAADAGLVGS